MSEATKYAPEINLADLAKPFSTADIDWRVQSSGMNGNEPWAMVLAYVDARAVMDRLDLVCGPGNWKDEYEHLAGGVMCRLSIRVNGEWVSKTNGAPETQVEAFKGGISKALVRTASNWSIGRYLYKLDTNYAIFVAKGVPGARYLKIDGKSLYWKDPGLPDWARPEDEKRPSRYVPVAERTEQPKPPGNVVAMNPAPVVSVVPKKQDDVGDYVAKFGKYGPTPKNPKTKNKALKDIPIDEIKSYVTFLEGDSKVTGKPIFGAVAEWVGKAREYIARFESTGDIPW